MSAPDSFTPYRYRTQVRWGDQDAQGHVNNVTFVDYMQEARVEWILGGPQAHMLGSGVLVTAHRLEYLAPAHFSEEDVEVRLWVTGIGGAKFSLVYDLTQGDRAVARAVTDCVTYDLEAGSLRRMTTAERAWLRQWSGPEPDMRQIPSSNGAWQPDFGSRHPLRVRWSELDSYGHINNVAFLGYLQEIRIAALGKARRESGWGSPDSDSFWLVAAQSIRYLAQLDYRPEPYWGEAVVLSFGRTSMTVEMRIRDPHTEVVYALGQVVLVHADGQGRPQEIGQHMRDLLAPITLAP